MKKTIFSVLVLVLLAGAFTQHTQVDETDAMAGWAITSAAWSDIPQPEGNAITEAKVELGKMLFFDPRLSLSNKMSCATCHDPEMGYGDGLPLLRGDNGQYGERHTPGIVNLAWSAPLMWDGRAETLEDQALGPIVSGVEMRQDIETLLNELKEAGYDPYFEKAFGPGTGVTPEYLGMSIATFERTLVSHNSPFDRCMTGDRGAMSPAQIRGKALFETKGRCIDCHNGPNFTDGSFHNIGVDTLDLGRFKHLPLPSQKYAFKTPGLRDVAEGAPYLHNGTAATLREVVELYNEGGRPETRDLPNLAIEPLGLTDAEIDDLVAFMQALTGEGPRSVTMPTLP